MLKDMCFYDFVRYIWKVKRGTTPVMQQLGTYARHELVAPHAQCDTHELIQHTDEALLNLKHEFVPRVIGCLIPQKQYQKYSLFALVHFILYSSINTVTSILGGRSLDVFVQEYSFNPKHLRIMNNWEEIHECVDEQDAERL